MAQVNFSFCKWKTEAPKFQLHEVLQWEGDNALNGPLSA